MAKNQIILGLLTLAVSLQIVKGTQCYICDYRSDSQDAEGSACKLGHSLPDRYLEDCNWNTMLPPEITGLSKPITLEELQSTGRQNRTQDVPFNCVEILIDGKVGDGESLAMVFRTCMASPEGIPLGCRDGTPGEWGQREDLLSNWIAGAMATVGFSDNTAATGCACGEDKCNGKLSLE